MSLEFTPEPRQESEARITALLLGELTGAEAASLLQTIEEDAELTAIYERLKKTIVLVREVAATPAQPVAQGTDATAPLRLSEERRQKLLAQFKTVKPKEFAAPKRKISVNLLELAAVLAILGLLAGMLLPSLSASKERAVNAVVISRLRQLDGAKQQWALEHHASPDAVPTLKDIEPYMGRGAGGVPQPIAGEQYVLGRVGQSPKAIGQGKIYSLDGDQNNESVVVQSMSDEREAKRFAEISSSLANNQTHGDGHTLVSGGLPSSKMASRAKETVTYSTPVPASATVAQNNQPNVYLPNTSVETLSPSEQPASQAGSQLADTRDASGLVRGQQANGFGGAGGGGAGGGGRINTAQLADANRNSGNAGDPEWVGTLNKPATPHSASNPFIASYGADANVNGSLDLGLIRDQAVDPATGLPVGIPAASAAPINPSTGLPPAAPQLSTDGSVELSFNTQPAPPPASPAPMDRLAEPQIVTESGRAAASDKEDLALKLPAERKTETEQNAANAAEMTRKLGKAQASAARNFDSENLARKLTGGGEMYSTNDAKKPRSFSQLGVASDSNASKVPLIGDTPALGTLFKSTTPAEDTKETKVFHLKNADSAEVADLLKSLYPDRPEQNGSGPLQRFRGFPPSGLAGGQQGGGNAGAGESAKDSSSVGAVADPRTQTIIVSADTNVMEQIEGLVGELDKKVAGQKKPFSVTMQNANPVDVLPILQGLFPSSATTPSPSSSESPQQLNALQNRQTTLLQNMNDQQGVSTFGISPAPAATPGQESNGKRAYRTPMDNPKGGELLAQHNQPGFGRAAQKPTPLPGERAMLQPQSQAAPVIAPPPVQQAPGQFAPSALVSGQTTPLASAPPAPAASPEPPIPLQYATTNSFNNGNASNLGFAWYLGNTATNAPSSDYFGLTTNYAVPQSAADARFYLDVNRNASADTPGQVDVLASGKEAASLISKDISESAHVVGYVNIPPQTNAIPTPNSLSGEVERSKEAVVVAGDQGINRQPLTSLYDEKKNELEQLKKYRDVLALRTFQEGVEAKMPNSTGVAIVEHADPDVDPNSTLGGSISHFFTGNVERRARIKAGKYLSDVAGADGKISIAGSYDPYFFQTEEEALQSEPVLDKVIQKLDLQNKWAEKNEGQKLSLPEARQMLKKQLDVKADSKTSLLDIGVKAKTPEEAARLANTVAETYSEYRKDEQKKLTLAGTEQFKVEMAKANAEVKQKEMELAELSKKTVSAQVTPQIPDAPLPKSSEPPPIPQPEVFTSTNAFSTFSLNIADVSFKLAAANLEKGLMPEPASIRSEEFVNAFDYRDPEAPPGVPIAFTWDRAAYPFAQNRDLLRFSLKTAATGRAPGRPLNIVLLLDNSGSMERADRVRIIHEALRVLAGQLQPQDTLSIVTFARTARLFVDGVPGNQAADVIEQVSGLTPQGGTNLEDAMKLAYETALRHYLANGVNRVVLLTDGAANLGDVDPIVLKQSVEAHRKQGIALDCFGIGWEDYNDDLLEVLARNGDGRYGFLNSPEEAADGFAHQLAGALNVAASDVKVQVEFNPRRVTVYRQIGYAKLQLTKEQFRDNTVAAAQIGAAEEGNALYVVQADPNGDGPLATVRVRYRVPGTDEVHEHEWSVPYTGGAISLDQATPAMRLAATASAFSEWLASSPYATEVSPDALLKYMGGVPETFAPDARPKQLEQMIREAKSISGGK